MSSERIAIIGGGNLGSAIACGLVSAGICTPESITITRRSEPPLGVFREEGFHTTTDNAAHIRQRVTTSVPILRAMPNIGVGVGQSMTCLACESTTPDQAREAATATFPPLGPWRSSTKIR
jgi:pyrroline-5-carboxylate reductase